MFVGLTNAKFSIFFLKQMVIVYNKSVFLFFLFNSPF